MTLSRPLRRGIEATSVARTTAVYGAFPRIRSRPRQAAWHLKVKRTSGNASRVTGDASLIPSDPILTDRVATQTDVRVVSLRAKASAGSLRLARTVRSN